MASRGGRAGSLAPSEGDGVSAGEQEGLPPPPLSRVAQLQGRRHLLCYPIDIPTFMYPHSKRVFDKSDPRGGRPFTQVTLPRDPNPIGFTKNYRVGRPIVRKVLKIRIWAVPPVCLGSR